MIREDEEMGTSQHWEGRAEMEVVPLKRVKLTWQQKLWGWVGRSLVKHAPAEALGDLLPTIWEGADIGTKEEITAVLARQAVIERMEQSVMPQVFAMHEEQAGFMVADLKAALEGTREMLKPKVVLRFQDMEKKMARLEVENLQHRAILGIKEAPLLSSGPVAVPDLEEADGA